MPALAPSPRRKKAISFIHVKRFSCYERCSELTCFGIFNVKMRQRRKKTVGLGSKVASSRHSSSFNTTHRNTVTSTVAFLWLCCRHVFASIGENPLINYNLDGNFCFTMWHQLGIHAYWRLPFGCFARGYQMRCKENVVLSIFVKRYLLKIAGDYRVCESTNSSVLSFNVLLIRENSQAIISTNTSADSNIIYLDQCELKTLLSTFYLL